MTGSSAVRVALGIGVHDFLIALGAMSLGRRKVSLDDNSAWVFNRMVQAYEARPPYPEALVAALSQLAQAAGGKRARIVDVGAGLGHLALPLAERGFVTTAVEPAAAMLKRLTERARLADLSVCGVHGMAESMDVADASFDLVVVADAIHFLDSERAARELERVLAPGGAVALVTCEFSPTAFMQAVTHVMQEAAPRRPRDVSAALTELLAVSGIRAPTTTTYSDATRVDSERLIEILRSISFIGPAMNPERAQAFQQRILAIKHEPLWARQFTVHSGTRA